MHYPINITLSLTFNSTNASILIDYDDGQKINIFEEGLYIIILLSVL